MSAADYDAVLILSYGGPESPDEIEPFLTRLFAGKPVPPSAWERAREKYRRIGGKSPLPEESRRYLAEVQKKLPDGTRACSGYLYSPPLLEDAVREIADRGAKSVLVFIASPFDSPQSFGRYRDRVGRAFAAVPSAPRYTVVPPQNQNPKWIRGETDLLLTLLAETELETLDWETSPAAPSSSTVLFTAHSIPETDAAASGYETQLLAAASRIAELAGLDEKRIPYRLVYQSRSGRPGTPWLGPDIQEFLRADRAASPGRKRYLVLPIGFFFDNLETVYDLDLELSPLAEELGITIKRAPAFSRAGRSPSLLLEFLEP